MDRLNRVRDGQQWILDYVIKTTGRTNTFEQDGRDLPLEVKSHAMIPKVLGKKGLREEKLARDAECAGHRQVALMGYVRAVRSYMAAQHAIYDTARFDERRFWMDRAQSCNERIRVLARHHIERVEVPWGEVTLSGHLHLQKDPASAPTILFIPGMDGTKETSGIGPLAEVFMSHGVNVIAVDGPGQGESLLSGIHVTDSNYEEAVSAVIDYLVSRPEIDPERLGLIGRSFGSFWGMRSAARDDRIRALAVDAVTFGDKRAIFDTASPRFKQIFMTMAGETDESRFDAMADRMVAWDDAPRIACPVLISAGEYDPLTNLGEVERLFESLGGPKELWVLENQFHSYANVPGLCGIDDLHFLVDWVVDALDGKLPEGHRRVTLVSVDGSGPYRDHDVFRPWVGGVEF